MKEITQEEKFASDLINKDFVLRTSSRRQSKSEGNKSSSKESEESKTSDPSTPPMDQDIVDS